MQRDRRRDVLISASAFWVFALGLFWFSFAGQATETKPGGATQDSSGHWRFIGSSFGSTPEPGTGGKRTPARQSKPAPAKKNCNQFEKDKKDKCDTYSKVQKDYAPVCGTDELYNKHKAACDNWGPGLNEAKTACDDAKCALAKCQGKKCEGESSPNPSAPPCQQLKEYADTACEYAHEMFCACSGSAYSKNYDWCKEAHGNGQTVEAWLDSLRNSCQEMSNRLKQKCPKQKLSYVSNAPCQQVQKPTRHQVNCWKLLHEILGCNWKSGDYAPDARCDKLREQYDRDCE